MPKVARPTNSLGPETRMARHDEARSETSITLLARVALSPPEPDAWNEFVDRYGPRIVKWSRAWGLQAADIDDVTQSVLATLLVRLRRFDYDPARGFRGFLRKVTNDTVCDVISARGRLGGASATLQALAGKEARADLARALEDEFDLELLEKATWIVRSQVEPRTWEAYRLTAEEGLSGIEAATRLGMGAGAVYQAKSAVLRRLHEEVSELEQGPRATKST
jgi:RNA polymerase sigma factor (sigma-70 family)